MAHETLYMLVSACLMVLWLCQHEDSCCHALFPRFGTGESLARRSLRAIKVPALRVSRHEIDESGYDIGNQTLTNGT